MKISFKDIVKYEKERRTTKQDRSFVYAINIDLNKKKEHVLVGEEVEVAKAIYNQQSDLIYNANAPLGNFFSSFPCNIDEEWNEFVEFIISGYDSMRYPRNLQKYMNFLEIKFKSKNPVNMFVSTQILFNMFRCHNMNNGYNLFRNSSTDLFKHFGTSENENLFDTYKVDSVNESPENFEEYSHGLANEIKVIIVDGKEYLLVHKSFKPLIDIYIKRLNDGNFSFKKCLVCGKNFMATHKNTKLCSNKCKQEQVAVNKQNFIEHRKDSDFIADYQTTYSFWYNRMKELRLKLVHTDNQKSGLIEIEECFSEFKRNSKELKSALKLGEIEIEEFKTYLSEQEKLIGDFYEKWKM